ncbi:MAG: aldolase/citrate lyase family protein [Paracoccaceae bacterium]|nr:aldolase/citrate lyase family protein [Paracoccaceae bacterium]
MAYGTFSDDVRSGKRMIGTFVKTPEVMVVETLARAGLDFICLDGEHAPLDRARLDACLAVGRGLGLPCLVRVPAARGEYILQALDMGAAGLVIPHIDSAEKAAEMGRLSRFGNGGRGFAGSTRGSDWGAGGMAGVLARGGDPVVFVQIEEPEGVEAAEGIAAAPGIDGVFLGPADLSVGYGHADLASADLAAAYVRVGSALRETGGAYATFAPTAEAGRALEAHGVTMLFVGSELGWMAEGARAAAAAFRG